MSVQIASESVAGDQVVRLNAQVTIRIGTSTSHWLFSKIIHEFRKILRNISEIFDKYFKNF